jgi:hypothetical protein
MARSGSTSIDAETLAGFHLRTLASISWTSPSTALSSSCISRCLQQYGKDLKASVSCHTTVVLHSHIHGCCMPERFRCFYEWAWHALRFEKWSRAAQRLSTASSTRKLLKSLKPSIVARIEVLMCIKITRLPCTLEGGVYAMDPPPLRKNARCMP